MSSNFNKKLKSISKKSLESSSESNLSEYNNDDKFDDKIESPKIVKVQQKIVGRGANVDRKRSNSIAMIINEDKNRGRKKSCFFDVQKIIIPTDLNANKRRMSIIPPVFF